MGDAVLYDVAEGIATITLNHPDRMNALDTDLSNGLIEQLEIAGADPAVRCVIITGAGRGFCAGADLQEVMEKIGAGERMDPGQILRQRYNPIVLGIVDMQKPVIAAVNGAAAGAGASLALACDMRIASEHAKFLQAFIKIGLIPDSGAHYLLTRLVGTAKALELALLGDTIGADDALALGLVNKVVPADDLMSEARALAQRFAQGPTRAYGLTKQAMRFAATNDLAAVLDLEADLQDQASLTKDSIEGISAFVEKRAPRFEGR